MSWLSSIDRKLLRDLSHLSGQAFAIAIIVACGVGILVMALGALNSLQLSQSTYYDRYRFADVFATVKRAPERLIHQILEVEGVREAETRIVEYVTLDIVGFDDPANAVLVSLPELGEPRLNRVLLYEGRWPDPRRPDEVVTSKAFLDAHGFRIGDTVGATINGRARRLDVVGVGDSPEYIYTLGPGALVPDDQRFGVFWMGRKALEAAFDLEGAFSDVSVTLSRSASTDRVIDALDDLLDPYGGVGAYDRSDQLSHAFINSEMQQLKTMARIIPPVFLLVSAMLLNAILTRLILTERQQIGLLKAFGYSSGEIAWHYVKLALAITALGILAGFALGAGLARLVTNLYADSFRFPVLIYRLSPSAFVFASAAAAIAAIGGALSAAMGAGRLAPAEAMSPAPPAVYRRGVLQKLSARFGLDEPTRMIFRHIFRWPGRAATTVFGVAAAQALLVGTLFAFDSTDALLDQYFNRTDPYDASISFVEPQNRSAIEEIARLPGVLSVEPTRDMVARMINGAIEERGYVLGLEPNGRLKQLLDGSDQPMPPPEEGIALSSQLASMLEIGLGERLTLEVLEGRRPVVDLSVTAIVEEYIASPAYLSRAAANQLLMETDVASGVYVKLDGLAEAAFAAAVEDVPGVSSVALTSAAVGSFEETIEETISVMMTIYAIIGAAIAGGVVYNAARIALTERGRELASLRVLGFTRAEASYILLGELGLLVLAALPIGAILGWILAWAVATGMSSELFRIPLIVQPSTHGAAILIVMAGAAISAFLVRRRIDELDMIAVLKTRE